MFLLLLHFWNHWISYHAGWRTISKSHAISASDTASSTRLRVQSWLQSCSDNIMSLTSCLSHKNTTCELFCGNIVLFLHSCLFRFDTSLGGFKFSDQFLQISTKLPSSNVYGFAETMHESFKHNMNWKSYGMWGRDEPVGVWDLNSNIIITIDTHNIMFQDSCSTQSDRWMIRTSDSSKTVTHPNCMWLVQNYDSSRTIRHLQNCEWSIPEEFTQNLQHMVHNSKDGSRGGDRGDASPPTSPNYIHYTVLKLHIHTQILTQGRVKVDKLGSLIQYICKQVYSVTFLYSGHHHTLFPIPRLAGCT